MACTINAEKILKHGCVLTFKMSVFKNNFITKKTEIKFLWFNIVHYQM